VVKGWAVERASEILRAGGSRAHTVNGGGDLQLVGEPRPGRPWRIGVAHPLRPGALATVVTVGGDHAVATSGTPSAATTSSTREPADPPPSWRASHWSASG
jgi:thiamine biosynthesis lipoprotein